MMIFDACQPVDFQDFRQGSLQFCGSAIRHDFFTPSFLLGVQKTT